MDSKADASVNLLLPKNKELSTAQEITSTLELHSHWSVLSYYPHLFHGGFNFKTQWLNSIAFNCSECFPLHLKHQINSDHELASFIQIRKVTRELDLAMVFVNFVENQVMSL
jgi:hypothetical protein